MKVGVFHPGTQHSWQTARALRDCGQLAWYATAIFSVADRWPYKIADYLPPPLKRRALAEFRRFYHPDLEPRYVRTMGVTEWAHRISARLRLGRVAKFLERRSNSAFAGPVSRLIEREPVAAVWGYNGSAREVFEFAKANGIKRILDRTIGHPAVYNRIIEDVFRQYPEFFTSADYKLSQYVIDRADQEHALADVILAGSEFCASTLRGAGPRLSDKIEILEYCFDDRFFAGPFAERKRRTLPINFVFLGQADPRKGIHLVLKVFEKIPETAATLTIVGKLQIPRETFARYADRVRIHPTVPRADVLPYFQKADCLVFPSYYEGAALSIYEALVCGLGIIQSKHMQNVADRGCGLLMQELSEAELGRCVMEVIEKPQLLDEWQDAAKAVVSDYTFSRYRARVGALADRIVQGNP